MLISSIWPREGLNFLSFCIHSKFQSVFIKFKINFLFRLFFEFGTAFYWRAPRFCFASHWQFLSCTRKKSYKRPTRSASWDTSKLPPNLLLMQMDSSRYIQCKLNQHKEMSKLYIIWTLLTKTIKTITCR